jgi:hypothetical protein
MAWIKRNLYFVIGSVIALALMGVGGYYLYTQIADESSVSDQIKAQYAELDRLVGQNPHPGNDTINNIQAAKDQAAALRAYVKKVQPYFQPIPPVPESETTNRISDREFASSLRITISQLQHLATNQSVQLPPDYYFTFEAQRKIMNFDAASIGQLAQHLGEIKTICELLFDAKVNSLDSIRREIVSPNDDSPPDYLTQKTVSTPLADLTPYEITFRCFSSELAIVLANFASSTNAFLVKTINVEPSGVGTMADEQGGSAFANQPVPSRMPVPYNPYRGGYPGMRRGDVPPPAAMMPAPVAPVSHSGPQVILNEHPLRVTLTLQVVKIKPLAAK